MNDLVSEIKPITVRFMFELQDAIKYTKLLHKYVSELKSGGRLTMKKIRETVPDFNYDTESNETSASGV